MMRLSCSLGMVLALSMVDAATGEPAAVDYDRQIRPLLADNCYACHGPDEANREGGFRLDQKESAFGEADSGSHVIVPGDVEASELFARLSTDDVDLRMPPEYSEKQLTAAEIDLIGQWISQGASWQEHWAFSTPSRPEIPHGDDSDWVRTPVDAFVLERLGREELQPSRPADKRTLLRRVTLDLTGLPPTVGDVDAFLADDRPGAYQRVVDRLLESPRYGEHMARFWLDAARYGDTHGLHLDNYREMWPYRDWVVAAFNDNMPFDRFVTLQLAGDLLPDPSIDDLIATGFNRCHVTTNEGGSIMEEVYVRNVVDRVVTTATVFMGLTFECTRCHDHKYDPFTMRDFYSMFAFFNSLDGNPMDGNKAHHDPVVALPTEAQRQERQRLEILLTRLERNLEASQASQGRDGKQEDDQPDMNKDAADESPQRKQLKETKQALEQLKQRIAATPIFQELDQPRAAYLLHRGEYDQRRDEVTRATPAVLPPLRDDAPVNRLGLARWLVDGDHPLTARVTVNRFWQQLFGIGLVKTAEDFGSQGEPPSHPKLLDWLAVQFVEDGWDVKAMMKRLVMSATYRQSSRTTPELIARDPANRLLARGPRFRLDAEMLRDQALAVSGLLVNELGGPSVKPPQPDGLWYAVGYSGSNTVRFKPDEGAENVYRRTLYTFIKRTSPPPQLSTFDAPSREFCSVRRERTNTPLQALLLMNDPQYVEAAKALADRVLREAAGEPRAKVEYLFELCTARPPDDAETTELLSVWRDHLRTFDEDAKAARAFLSVGDPAIGRTWESSELAAWTLVANLVLNLDEVITKN